MPASLRRCCLAVALCAPVWAGAQPLPELLRAALATDPAVQGAQAQLVAAEERLVQARAGFGPTVVATGSKSSTRYYESPAFEMRPFDSKQLNVQLTQPLLRPTLFASYDVAEAQFDQASAQLEQARAEATQRLVEFSFELLKARDALSLSRAQRAATLEQLSLAQRSFKVGISPVTDVREAEAKADLVLAQLAAAEYELDLKQQMLAEIVGRPVEGLLQRGLEGRTLPPLQPQAMLDWLGAALAQSPQMRQAQQALLAVEADERRAWHGHAPTVDFTVTLSKVSETGSTTSAASRYANSSAVGLTLNAPLFASGATHAKVREAMALRDKAQSEVDGARRTVTLGVRQGFSATLSAISQAQGLETATRSAELALRANRRGYEVGMKVNAEVLDSQSRLFEARRDLSRARYDAWFNYVNLKAVSGQLAETDVALIDGLLVAVDAELPAPGPRRPREESR